MIKLNPNQPAQESVEWFLPTGNVRLNGWQGGIIGSVAINDEYNLAGFPPLFATNALDGYLYIGSQTQITGKKVKGPLNRRSYDTPLIVFKHKIGPSISTPIFTDGYKLITASYNGVYLFNLSWEDAVPNAADAVPTTQGDYYRLRVEQAGRFQPDVSFESTPVVWEGKVMICGRDGWLHTLGA